MQYFELNELNIPSIVVDPGTPFPDRVISPHFLCTEGNDGLIVSLLVLIRKVSLMSFWC